MNDIIDNFLHFSELVQLFRIVLACLLGASIGFEREKYGRPAGLRTHMIVCVASSLANVSSANLTASFKAFIETSVYLSESFAIVSLAESITEDNSDLFTLI